MAPLTFWFELASTYSYLSAMRLPGLAAARGVPVIWRPFLLGPIFASQGWTTSPFKVYPAKGAHMWRDMERQTAKYGLPFAVPADMSGFPRNSVRAARLALVGLEAGWGAAFVQAAYTAQFTRSADIADDATLLAILGDIAIEDPSAALAQAAAPAIKAALRANTEAAQARGIFGAPSFTTGGELFWGDDRLEDALDWAAAPER